MLIGVVKERKNQENRVGMTPSGVKTLVDLGAKVIVEEEAGVGSGFSNNDYQKAGAKIIAAAKEVYETAEMIIKVKEPLKDEIAFYREGQTLFTYLHLAADRELTIELAKRGTTCIAYETIQLTDGSLPLLRPMSEVAGRIAVQLGAIYLQRDHGGKGLLLGGVPGVMRGKVTIIGAGIVGINSTQIAVGLGAQVTVLDINAAKLAYLDDIYGNRITTLTATPVNIEKCVAESDLLIGAVLIPGAKAPKLVTRSMLKTMEEGSVLVDVSVDQGGCIETTRPTTYDNPTFTVDGVIHYCVANMPGTVSRTSTNALTNATLPYAMEMVKKGIIPAVQENHALKLGINAYKGEITCEAVAVAHGIKFKPLDKLI